MSIKIAGAKDIERALSKLPSELSRTVEMSALRSGASPIAKKAKSLVKSDTGLLANSIGVNVRKGKKGAFTSEYTARVGARTGFGKEVTRKNGRKEYADPSKYAHLVELGTSRTSAKPFIRPAVESSGNEVIEGMAKGYERGLDRAVRKLRKS